jgi:hypothetical protein
MTNAKPIWNWTGVAPLVFDGRDSRLRCFLTEELPVTKSSHDEIVPYLVDLNARFERWLHQDEFGPTRKQQAAAVHGLMKAAQTLQKHFANSPPSLKSRFDTILRDRNDPLNSVLEALFEAAVDLEDVLSGTNAPNFHFEWASRLRDRVDSLMALSQVVDTNTDSKIFQNAIVRKFDYSAPIGTGFGFGDAERWLADYWNVLVNTLQAFNKRRGADERVSLKLLSSNCANCGNGKRKAK